MSFLARVTLAAFFALAQVSATRAQAQEPAPAAPSQANDFYTLQKQADAGDAQAQFALGNYYFRGRGVAQDYTQALIWYRRSADQGFAPAQNQLGNMYEHDFGVKTDYARAITYYHSASDQGYALAQYNLANMLENARGVRRDYRQALALYRKAAEQNLPEAEQEIGYFYQCGFVGPRDYAQAITWYRRAAAHGNSDAENQLGYMAGEGWGQPQDYVEALSWYYKAADHGNAAAQENIGYMFQHGTGVQTDYRQAMSWFYKAAGQGNSNAENQLGWMYQFGQGVQPDNGKALAWYRLAADQGNQNGINNLRAFTAILKQYDDSVWDAANASRILSTASTNSTLTPRKRTTSPTSSNTPARKTTPWARSSTPSAPSGPFNTAYRPKNIAPKLPLSATNSPKPNPNPNSPPTFPLPDALYSRKAQPSRPRAHNSRQFGLPDEELSHKCVFRKSGLQLALSAAEGPRRKRDRESGLYSLKKMLRKHLPSGCKTLYVLGLFFYFFNGMNLPPVRADFGVVAGDSFHRNRLANLWRNARNLGYALGHNATRAIHAFYFGVFANANVRVAVVFF